MFCKVIGDLELFDCWRKNGVFLLGNNKEILCMEKIIVNDSGNYLCEVYNYIKVELLIFFYVVVYVLLIMVD